MAERVSYILLWFSDVQNSADEVVDAARISRFQGGQFGPKTGAQTAA
jgi:hypothetical protein